LGSSPSELFQAFDATEAQISEQVCISVTFDVGPIHFIHCLALRMQRSFRIQSIRDSISNASFLKLTGDSSHENSEVSEPQVQKAVSLPNKQTNELESAKASDKRPLQSFRNFDFSASGRKKSRVGTSDLVEDDAASDAEDQFPEVKSASVDAHSVLKSVGWVQASVEPFDYAKAASEASWQRADQPAPDSFNPYSGKSDTAKSSFGRASTKPEYGLKQGGNRAATFASRK
jgi:hypothetical protein